MRELNPLQTGFQRTAETAVAPRAYMKPPYVTEHTTRAGGPRMSSGDLHARADERAHTTAPKRQYTLPPARDILGTHRDRRHVERLNANTLRRSNTQIRRLTLDERDG